MTERISQMSKPKEPKDYEILDLDQLRELNEANDPYRSKKDKFKVDTIIKSNNIQIQNDFIAQIKEEKNKIVHFNNLKNKVDEKHNDGEDMVVNKINKVHYEKIEKLIH
jgi:hypothetical protein